LLGASEIAADRETVEDEDFGLDDGPSDVDVPDFGIDDEDLEEPEGRIDDRPSPRPRIPSLTLLEVTGSDGRPEQRVDLTPPGAAIVGDLAYADIAQSNDRHLQALGGHLWATQPRCLRSRSLGRAFMELEPRQRATLTEVLGMGRSGVTRFLAGRAARIMAGVVPLDFFFWAEPYAEHDDRHLLATLARSRYRGDTRPLTTVLADVVGPVRRQKELERLGRRVLPTVEAVLREPEVVRAHQRIVPFDDGRLWKRLLGELGVSAGSEAAARMALSGALDPDFVMAIGPGE
jgi:hypothetical protein